jgi:hypothetical protein
MDICKIFLAFSLIISATGCRPETSAKPADVQTANPALHSQPISRAEGLRLAEFAARRNGYDLSRYKLDTFGNELSQDHTKWVFVYLLKPAPPPGGFFMVLINRRTGAAEISPGE